MRKTIFMNMVLAAAFAFTALFFTPHDTAVAAGADETRAFEKLDFGPGLYGLPHLGDYHGKAAYERLVEGDLYGLPFAGDFHAGELKTAWERLDYGHDLFGLPHAGSFHDSKQAWQKLDYGDDLFGLPYAGAYHGAAGKLAQRGDNACAQTRC